MTRISRRNPRGKPKTSPDGDQPPTDGSLDPNIRIPGGRDRNANRMMSFTLKILFFSGIILFIIGLFMKNYSVNSVKKSVRPRVVTPLPAPKLMDLSMFEGSTRRVYTGEHIGLMFILEFVRGLMWIGVKDGRYFMRHVCQDLDELKTYGWTHHNGRDYGRQIPYKVVSCDNAGNPIACPLVAITRPSFVYRKVLLKEDMENTVHLFFYVAEEGGNALHLGSGRSDIPDVYILAFGSRNDLGSWQLHLESKDDFEFHYAGFKTNHIHNLSELVQSNLGVQARKVGRLQLSDTSDDAPNILVFQISAMIPFKADIAFVSTSSGSSSRTEDRARSLIGDLGVIVGERERDDDDDC
ncbi:UNVERIFIED_CONTAM: Mannosyl-oligosaccharide glucosidase GCS1 [Sesamum angustifolium]|uniref:Mannosyl-oligosaccharide glucosidase n=1 Tax=Sesamum angustifolium TaxID=2727405 RepID=A0AAW2Q9B3_9LAMI